VRHTPPPCAFYVGDDVSRGGAGASVPKPGNGVTGNVDRVDGFSEITITTSTDGVVTVRYRNDRHPAYVEESCQLPAR
jgi:hypothetical protein